MTHRAGFEAARQVGELARPVSQVADEFGVCWDTDETSFLKANRAHPTVYTTGLVDTDAGILIDMVEGNTASDPTLTA